MIVGMNTDLVRRLLIALISEREPATEGVHPMLWQMYQHLVQEQKAPADGVGKFWRLKGVRVRRY